jgi:hypothetical protein
MKPLPKTKDPVALRTCFKDEAAWQRLRETMLAENDAGWQAYLEVVDDPAYADVTVEALVAGVGRDYTEWFLVIADELTFADAERPLLVLDLHRERGRSFRVIPAYLPDVTSNLSIANMDFAEFAEASDGDDVFRGFPGDRGPRKKLPDPIRPYQPTVLGRVLIAIYKLFRGKPKR